MQECPDYANTGVCNSNKCRLPHVDRAGQIRKIAANKLGNSTDASHGGMEDDNSSDVSSERDDGYDEINSDDVDSDGLLDEPMHVPVGTDTHELSQQQDFVQFET